MTATADARPAGGVSPWWRVVAAALLLYLAARFGYDRLHHPSPPAVQEAADGRLDQTLDSVDFDRTPLAAALADLGRRAGVSVVVRWDQLSIDYVTADTPVTLHLRRVTVATALDQTLRATDAVTGLPRPIPYNEPTWDERAGVVLVGTAGELPAVLGEPVTRVYDIRPLLAAATAAGGSIRVDRVPTTTLSTAAPVDPQDVVDGVQKYLVDSVRPTSWLVNGGDAGMRFWGGFLVVRHTERGQRDVAAALRSMRGGR